MKILITGTAGFIGHHCVETFAKEGFEVVGLDSINDYYDPNLKLGRLKAQGFDTKEIKDNTLITSKTNNNISFIKMNLEDKETMTKLFKEQEFDYVCHLAAQAGVRYSIENPDAYVQSNVVGFLNIIESCRHFNIKHLVFASSSSVYGLNKTMPFNTDDHTDHPISLYAATKKSNEMMAHTYAHLYNIPMTGLRFFTVYGEWGRPDMAPFLFTDAAFNNQSIKVFNNGDMYRDFTYVGDIVQSILRLIPKHAKPDNSWDPENPNPSSSSAPYKIYNIGNHKPVRLMDFIKAIENAVGKEIEKEMLPMQPGDVQYTYANVESLIKVTNYTPDTELQDGINKFVEWYKEFYL
jgi:UDP-glucuronate 4-epimerase